MNTTYFTTPSGVKIELGMRYPASIKNFHPCVYIVSGRGLFKIGRTASLERRLVNLRSVNDFPITMVHIIYSMRHDQLEHALHSMFAGKRIYGEWFDLNDSDVSKLKLMGTS